MEFYNMKVDLTWKLDVPHTKQQHSVCLSNNRKFGCVHGRRKTSDEISYSIQLDKKQKSISMCAGNQVKVENRNFIFNPWTLHDGQSFNNIHLNDYNNIYIQPSNNTREYFWDFVVFDMILYTQRNEFLIHGKLEGTWIKK